MAQESNGVTRSRVRESGSGIAREAAFRGEVMLIDDRDLYNKHIEVYRRLYEGTKAELDEAVRLLQKAQRGTECLCIYCYAVSVDALDEHAESCPLAAFLKRHAN